MITTNDHALPEPPDPPPSSSSSPPSAPAPLCPSASSLEEATALALAALCDIIRNSESSDRDRRLASVALLRHAAAMKPRTLARTPAHDHDETPKPRQMPPPGWSEDDGDDWWPSDTPPPQLGPDHPNHPYAQDIAHAYERGYDDAHANRPRHTPGLIGRMDRAMYEFSGPPRTDDPELDPHYDPDHDHEYGAEHNPDHDYDHEHHAELNPHQDARQDAFRSRNAATDPSPGRQAWVTDPAHAGRSFIISAAKRRHHIPHTSPIKISTPASTAQPCPMPIRRYAEVRVREPLFAS